MAASSVNQQRSPEESTSKAECKISEAARNAIDTVDEMLFTGSYTYSVYDLLWEAEAAAEPPECDSTRAMILADKALRMLQGELDSLSVPKGGREGISAGLGVGIPYGYFGLNIEHPITKNTEITLGLGSTFLGGAAANIGFRYYPNPSSSRLRYTLLYGTNALIREDASDISSFLPFGGDYSTHEGLSVGLGWGSKHSDSSWDFDFIFVVTSSAFDRIDELEDRGEDPDGPSDPYLSFSFGYHWQ